MGYIDLVTASKKYGIALSTLRYNYDNGAFLEDMCEVEIRGRQKKVKISEQYLDRWYKDWIAGRLPKRVKGNPYGAQV